MASRKFDIYDLLSVKYLYSHKCDSLRIFINNVFLYFSNVVLLVYNI